MFQKKNNDPSLCEELPYWEFQETPRPHLILSDGSLVFGIKLSLLDIECFDDNEVNQLAVRLRGVLNSISENTSVQFCLSVSSDFSNTLKKHIDGKITSIHPLVASIADYREKKLQAAQDSSELYRPELSIYLRTQMVGSKKLSFIKKKEDFSVASAQNYEETLEVLFQNVDTLISSFASIGLTGRSLATPELKAHIYSHLNPKRSKSEPVPQVRTPAMDNVEKETLNDDE